MLLQYSITDSVIKSARMHVEKGVPQGGLINGFTPFKVKLCLNIWLSGICGKRLRRHPVQITFQVIGEPQSLIFKKHLLPHRGYV